MFYDKTELTRDNADLEVNHQVNTAVRLDHPNVQTEPDEDCTCLLVVYTRIEENVGTIESANQC